MAKTKISEYDSTAGNNTDINSINIDEGCSPSGINNAIRALMSHLKNWQGGTSGDALPVASGGTGAVTAGAARTALSAAASGANSDITSITGLTTPLTIAQGGTGTASTAHTSLTTNVTGTLPVANGGTGVTVSTGSGNNVLSTSPTLTSPVLTTPDLGTPSALVATNASGTANSLNAGIGVNQTWSNPSRAANTTYTNSTGKPILVAITNQGSSSGGGITVAGVTIGSWSNNGNSNFYLMSFIVPNGATYSTFSVVGSFSYWAELR